MLNTIVAAKQVEVARQKAVKPMKKLLAGISRGDFPLTKVLCHTNWILIAECKLASPVKGPLSNKCVGELAGIYEGAGASVLSVLTDCHFSGCLAHIEEACAASTLPILRKDFIIDEYQLIEARVAGAAVVLLIAAILTDAQLKRYLAVAEGLGLDCLVEVHNREELERVQQTSASIIGINNRDLRTFTTSLERTFELLPYCDSKRVIISESGIGTAEAAAQLREAGVRGALVGEGLVRAADIAAKVRELSLQNEGG